MSRRFAFRLRCSFIFGMRSSKDNIFPLSMLLTPRQDHLFVIKDAALLNKHEKLHPFACLIYFPLHDFNLCMQVNSRAFKNCFFNMID